MEKEHESIVFGEHKEKMEGYVDDFRVSKNEEVPDLSEKHVYPELSEMEGVYTKMAAVRVVATCLMAMCWFFVGFNVFMLHSKGWPVWDIKEMLPFLINLAAGIMLAIRNQG